MSSLRMALAAATALVAVAAAVPADAASITFTFTNTSTGGGTNSGSGYGNVRSYATPVGLTMTARAFTLLNVHSWYNPNPEFTTSQLGHFDDAGLGVCNRDERTGCRSPNHQVDNSSTLTGFSDKDFVLFQFDPAVSITSAFVRTFSNSGTDVSYFLGNAANPLALAGNRLTNLAGLGFGSESVDTSTGGTNDVAINAGPFNSLLIGARLSDINDAFKIQTLTIEYTPPPQPQVPVPEPMAITLLATGLLGLGAAARRRRAAA